MKPIHKNTLLALSMAALTTLSLLGCSGGGGGGPTAAPTAPSVTLTPTATKTFAFNWSDVSEESEYRLLENPDGMSGFSQVAVIPKNSTAHNLTVSLPQRVNAKYILQACNSKGCADSDTMYVTGSLAEAVGYFKASNAEAGDGFGYAVALSADGRVMAVSAAWEDSAAGAAYVFTNSNGVWSQQAYIKASNNEEGDEFGTSLALSADGSTLAVSALREGSGATGVDGDQTDNSAYRAGAVYVFTQSGNSWTQQAYIKASNTEPSDSFGQDLALSSDGTTLAVGVPFEDSDASGIDGDQTNSRAGAAGAVYVFTQSGGTWAQQAYIKASNTETVDLFGSKVALSSDGNRLAVSAPQEDSSATGIGGDQADNGAEASGAVYMFTRSDDTWAQQAYIKASNTGEGDRFGYSLALSADGGALAVGAYVEDSSATGIDGDQADNSANGTGAVYVFTLSGDAWSQQSYIKASTVENNDAFGSNLALSADGATLAVGAIWEDSSATGINGDQADNTANSSGAVYLFTLDAGIWSQQAYIKASNTGEGGHFKALSVEAADEFGSSLALSSDGGVLAVGATWEDSSATGINGDQADNSAEDSGAVYLY